MDSQYGISLEQRFREKDLSHQGVIKKIDFLLVIEENVRDLQRNQIENFIDLVIPPADNVVNYSDFMKILYKFGEGFQQNFGAMAHQPVGSSLNASLQETPLAEKMGASFKDQLFERMKAAYSRSSVEEEMTKRSKEGVITKDSLTLSLLTANFA